MALLGLPTYVSSSPVTKGAWATSPTRFCLTYAALAPCLRHVSPIVHIGSLTTNKQRPLHAPFVGRAQVCFFHLATAEGRGKKHETITAAAAAAASEFLKNYSPHHF